MRKIGLFLLVMATTGAANAGFNGFTIHSRANCANNESISWDWNHYYVLRTTSEHYYPNNGKNGEGHRIHTVDTGWETTWRSAAVHWGEGTGKWWAYGYHYIKEGRNTPRLIDITFADNCAIYDGWWDKNK